jgi:hypothetical protein
MSERNSRHLPISGFRWGEDGDLADYAALGFERAEGDAGGADGCATLWRAARHLDNAAASCHSPYNLSTLPTGSVKRQI